MHATFNIILPPHTHMSIITPLVTPPLEGIKLSYYQRNRDKIISKQKNKYSQNREQLLAYQKEYNKQHHEEYLRKQKDWYQINRETILAKRKEKITCECGKEITSSNMSKHRQTSIHFKRMAQHTTSINNDDSNDPPDNLEEFEQIILKKL